MSDNPYEVRIEVLHRMLDDAVALTRLGDDPVLVPRSEFLVAYLTDALALVEPAVHPASGSGEA